LDERAESVINVGLTGGIASGKTEVARRLASLGARVIDSDALARAALAPGTSEFARVVAEFGPEVLSPDGSLDRAALAAAVFEDAASPARRAALNAIVHPYVAARTAEIMLEVQETGPPDAVVVHDVPLLVENHLAKNYDLVVVVDASPETQLKRLVDLRGMSADQARARIAAQASREQRRAVADVVIDNDGSVEDLRRQVQQLWARLKAAA
jgi:dephospho-CoA kinase